MAYIVTSECINCGACAIECPQGAIHQHKKFSSRKSSRKFLIGNYFINPFECNQCSHKRIPLCVEICPMNCIVK